ncbi:MAG: hypothetical protein CO096_17780 [Armatimonadetes bacterium CG_4_9_14_3_um_filter_66_14]|nr:MAG: hypothetical protein COS65_00515 [Armatimonadetes bacterium CG06_land_8_20_14_3_00_66_21]PIX42923.1 MAG: hypothetical protein COZ57_20350 [Armatimonadetes bacterium CG_4_8_14_3_um_filter_66_20]PJB65922.1 MAG: hypothetical protein CO096_17780 [Armatimonadetes bacterium CG_4_9_14_3_um_filter_66_14]
MPHPGCPRKRAAVTAKPTLEVSYLKLFPLVAAAVVLSALAVLADQAGEQRYYAHGKVEDANGVIAPWYQGQNGQCDLRVRIAAETLKRYPWVGADKSVTPGPHFVFNGHWSIAADGAITVPTEVADWNDGDLGQRAAYVLASLIDYYRYSGDPAAVSLLSVFADFLLDHCQTTADHPWPRFLISCPTKGKHYAQADPTGFIQLDLVAEAGTELVRAYELTGNKRWLDAALHWAELLAEKRGREPGTPPWGRYANPEDVPWGKSPTGNLQTGGVAFLLAFFDQLIRLGYTGSNDCLVDAREAGRAYLRDQLLPRWTVDDTWGRNYWDWEDPVHAENVTEWVVQQLLDHPDVFPNWRADARNILSLFLNRTSVSPNSRGDVYSGAWAYPESSGCCGRSLWYGPLELAPIYAKYGVLVDSEWAREMGRRQMLLATYDIHETGVVEDNLDGGQIVAGGWFKIAHPMALKHVLHAMAWLPEEFGANRENHLVRTDSVVRSVVYGDGRVAYTTFDAPPPSVDVLRLAFRPLRVTAESKPLGERQQLDANGFQLTPLPGGDFVLTIRHDGCLEVVVEGDDPQQVADDSALQYQGDWSAVQHSDDCGGGVHSTSTTDAAASFDFTGNQVRLVGAVGPVGGTADVYLDGTKQLAGIDCWCPQERRQQVLYYKNGLAPGKHTLKVVARGEKNPLSQGTTVSVDAVQWSAAEGRTGFGEGGGPTEAQRVIFGYTDRTDSVDSAGNAWRPATEFVGQCGNMADVVVRSWWTTPQAERIANTPDPELYRRGAHGRDLTAYFTVGPGSYHVRLKLAETRDVELHRRLSTIEVNGSEVVEGLDIAATAGGLNRAVDLVFNDVRPKNGVIAVRFRNRHAGEAIIQAIEVGPGDGGPGAKPVVVDLPWEPELVNAGFEDGVAGATGSDGSTTGGLGWTYVFQGKKRSYVWGETGFDIHPDWGPPMPRTAKEALRTHTDGEGHNLVYQDVEVRPAQTYTASVWVRARDLHGKGFGTTPGDSAGLLLYELDATGAIQAKHPKRALREAGEWVKLETTFAARPDTRTVRFVLDTVIGCKYDEGSVTYDDCALVAQAKTGG